MPNSSARRIVASRFAWLSGGISFGLTSCHLYWYRIPPHEMTGMFNSVRPNRRYFIGVRIGASGWSGNAEKPTGVVDWIESALTGHDPPTSKALRRSEKRYGGQ